MVEEIDIWLAEQELNMMRKEQEKRNLARFLGIDVI